MNTPQGLHSTGRRLPFWVVLGLILVPPVTPPLVAQHAPLHSHLLEGPVVGIEFFRPHVRDSEGETTRFWSSGMLLTFSRPLGDRHVLSVELPAAWGSITYDGMPELSPESGQILGNPEIAVTRTLDESGSVRLTLGGRLPLNRDFGDRYVGTGIGFLADPTRLDRWVNEMGTVFVGAEVIRTTAMGIDVAARLSPGYWYSTRGNGGESEFMAHYGLAASRHGEALFGGVELAGLAYLGDDADGFSDRTIHRLEGELGTTFRRLKVAGFARVSLKDDLAASSRYAMGVRVRAPLH